MEYTYIVNHMCAKNDINGNPRRCFVVQNLSTGLIDNVINEGFSGRQAWRDKYPTALEGVRFDVTLKEYKTLIKNWGRRVDLCRFNPY